MPSTDFHPDGGFGFRLVCCDRAALQVFDLGSSPAPTLRTQFSLAATSAFGLEIVQIGARRYAVVAGINNLHVVDVTDPGKPKQISQIELGEGTGSPIMRVEAIGAGLLWMANSWKNWLLDVRNPVAPVTRYMGPNTYDFAHAGLRHSYQGNEGRLLILRPITTLAERKVEANWSPSEAIYDVHEVGTTLYVGTASGITVLDIKNPAAPVVLERAGISGGARQLEAAGNNLFALGGSDRVVVFTYRNN